MTVTDRTAATEQEFRDRIAAFETAPTPPEVREAAVLEEVARAMCAADGIDWETVPDLHSDYRRGAAAAVAAYRAQAGGAEAAVRRVEALADEWSSLSSKHYTLLADRLRAALAPQAGDGAR